MKKRMGRPPTGRARTELMQIRMTAAEKQAFVNAAAVDGKDASEWVRDRLRRAAREELSRAGQLVPFIENPHGKSPGKK